MKEVDENGKTFKRKANGEIFRGIDIQLELGLITKEKHEQCLARGIYGCVYEVPHPFYEIVFPHRWFE